MPAGLILCLLAACGGDYTSPTAPPSSESTPPPTSDDALPQTPPTSQLGSFVGSASVLDVTWSVEGEAEQCAVRELARGLGTGNHPFSLQLRESDAGWIGWQASVDSAAFGCSGACQGAWWPASSDVEVEVGYGNDAAMEDLYLAACREQWNFELTGFTLRTPQSSGSGFRGEASLSFAVRRAPNTFESGLLVMRVRLDLRKV